MSRIVIWDYGYSGAEDIAAAIAIVTSLYQRRRVLLINEEDVGHGVEQGFPVYDAAVNRDSSKITETGTEALLRLLITQRISRYNFVDYTRPLINSRLDLIPGASGGLNRQADAALLQQLYAVAEDVYEFVFLHRSGMSLPVEEAEEVLLLPVLQQNRIGLDPFFAYYRSCSEVSRNKVKGIILRNYDRQAKWNIANIKRYYNCEIPIYGICYDTGFADSWNEHDLLRYFRRIHLPGRMGAKRGTMLEALQELGGALSAVSDNYLPPSSLSDDKGA
ncbi:hypothetical protein RE628_11880 [Paenibacillus sp. D2_2]|uniref:hypothetical protein n=1 Tax=Paenibacillus sp. D2_2 TaxID=3073092 RepID=UPI002814E8C2|nr:hypothetical protein [Paenibacillus sp. D2_2]WMT42916.1 hypothetical protein RE628_11880 [Paenibacillus sp. D2_2]